MSSSGVAVVSGASRGLGASIAHRLAADGWPAAVNYRHARPRPSRSSERSARPDDVAAMVAHLASDAAGFITGQCFTVNGGHVM